MTRPWPALLFVLLLALLVNFNVLFNGFGWDDEGIIKSQRLPDHWWSLFIPNLSLDPISKTVAHYYRPLVSASYALDSIIWGHNPFGFHLSVLLAHLLNTGLLFLLAQTLIEDKSSPYTFLPLVTASLFAVHPIHAEAVAWIAGRNDVFCTTFILSSILLYIQFRRMGKEWIFGLSMLSLFCALLTKEMALGLVLLYPLYDYFSEPPTQSHPRPFIGIRFFIPLGILGYYFFLRTRNITYPLSQLSSENALSPFFTVIGAIGLYLKMMVFPYPHNPFIAALPRSSIFLLLTGLGLVLLVGGVVWTLYRRHRPIGWGLALTVALLAPAILIAFQTGAATPAAERYVYAPSIGLLIAFAGWLFYLMERLQNKTAGKTCHVWLLAILVWVFLLLFLGRESSNRNSVWRTPLTFWEAAVAVMPGNESQEAIAHNSLGLAYMGQERLEEAIQEFQNALKLSPGYYLAHYNLGTVHKDRKQFEEAIQDFQIAQKLQPDFSEAHFNLGVVYEELGRLDEAIQEYQAGLKINPNDALAHRKLANALLQKGRSGEAETENQIASKLQPDLAVTQYNLGLDMAEQGRLDEAIQKFQTAISLDPNYESAHFNLGLAHARVGRLTEAVQEFEIVIRLKQDDVEAHAILGDLYKDLGNLEKAKKHYRQALQIKPDFIQVQKALDSLSR